MPTALLLIAGAVLIPDCRLNRRAVISAASLGISVLITLLPFALHYTSPVGAAIDVMSSPLGAIPGVGVVFRTLGLVVWPKSQLSDLLLIYGLFLLVILIFVVSLWCSSPSHRQRPPSMLVALTPVLIIIAFVAHFSALAVFGMPLLALLWLTWHGERTSAPDFTAWLFGVTFFLILIVEVVFPRDVFGDRMNTVFKVYFQVWGLLAIAAASAIPPARAAFATRLGRVPASVMEAIVALLIAGAALYTPISAYHWDKGFATWHGLNWLAYITRSLPPTAR